MIPRSINKKTNNIIDQDWDIKDESINNHMSSITDGITDIITDDIADEYIDDYETDETEECFSQSDYNKLREGINLLYETQQPDLHTNKSYIYSGLEILEDNIDDLFIDIQEKDVYPTVHICAYHVNLTQKQPFLQYFLLKNTDNKNNSSRELFQFPKFQYTNCMNVLDKSIMVMNVLCMSYYKDLDYSYKGYINDNNNLYLFFDCTELIIDSVKLYRANDLWLITIDEIINQERVCNFNISSEVVEFFKLNNKLLCLTDLNNTLYEIPTVVYAGCPRKKLDLTSVFGIGVLNNESLMGKNYYYTNYHNAIKSIGWLNETEGCGGIIRCALFLNKMKIPINNREDHIDESRITRELLLKYKETSKEYNYFKLLMRVSDRDGLWREQYDSVYIGKIELDNGSFFEDYPLWVVKDYDQQVILSSHIIDKKTLGDEWSTEGEYYIL
jgi:hypothetical protein